MIHSAVFVIIAAVFSFQGCLVIYPLAKSHILFRRQFSIPCIPFEKNVKILPAMRMLCVFKMTNFVPSSSFIMICFESSKQLNSHCSIFKTTATKYLFKENIKLQVYRICNEEGGTLCFSFFLFTMTDKHKVNLPFKSC